MDTTLIKTNKSNQQKLTKINFWQDSLVHDYYIEFYNNLSSNELDKEFRKDIKMLTKALSKLDEHDRKTFIRIMSKYVENYISHKIEKEIDNSFSKIFMSL